MTTVATDAQDGKHWYAVHTRGRHEKMVARMLTQKGIEQLLPLRRVLSRWADRKKWVEEPLFPGYLFVHALEEKIPTVRRTRGVARVLGPERSKPSIVPDAEVENVRRLVNSQVAVHPWPYLEPGQLVRITRGPLRGVKGTLIRRSRRRLLVISVDLLGRSVAAEVSADAVRGCSTCCEQAQVV